MGVNLFFQACFSSSFCFFVVRDSTGSSRSFRALGPSGIPKGNLHGPSQRESRWGNLMGHPHGKSSWGPMTPKHMGSHGPMRAYWTHGAQGLRLQVHIPPHVRQEDSSWEAQNKCVPNLHPWTNQKQPKLASHSTTDAFVPSQYCFY